MRDAGGHSPFNNSALWLWVPGRASLARDDAEWYHLQGLESLTSNLSSAPEITKSL
ncbi:hypothetical protein BEL01nite_24000 [Bradyrhizobium elkanii]|nr:hypothetical protein BEL01nite_24000 [Bradyrhizobium elkanii]